MIFLFFGERGKRGKGFRVTNVNWGLGRGCTRWGDKSGIWRFYRRVWKNIFYERRDKERERGVLGEMERGFLGYVWEGITYTIYNNKSELQKCNSAFSKGVGVSIHC